MKGDNLFKSDDVGDILSEKNPNNLKHYHRCTIISDERNRQSSLFPNLPALIRGRAVRKMSPVGLHHYDSEPYPRLLMMLIYLRCWLCFCLDYPQAFTGDERGQTNE